MSRFDFKPNQKVRLIDPHTYLHGVEEGAIFTLKCHHLPLTVGEHCEWWDTEEGLFFHESQLEAIDE